MNEFESMFGQDKDANGNRMFTPVSAAGFTYVNLGGSIAVNAATLPNVDLPTDPFTPDLEDTADLQDTGIFSGAYDDAVEGAMADFNNLELTIVFSRYAIGTKWVYRNKKDERGIVVRNKTRLVAQGYTQEEGVDYDEVFAPVARIEAIRLFLAYASFMGFIVYQMDVQSAFLYGTIEEEVYVCQPLGFEDPHFPNKVYKVENALYGLHQAPRACQERSIKKGSTSGEYDLWSIRMEQYLTHTDYALWGVIMNGDAPASIASVSGGAKAVIPPETTEQKIATRNELKAKTKFGGNKKSKKMQKTILKQQYKNFAASRAEGLHKTYDRFQKLISQLEIHSEVNSQEDANLKLLRSLPPAWNTHTLIMRNKSDLDTLSIDDLYNNLKVYEAKIKGQSSSSSYSQNVAFVSLDNTSAINEAVNTAHDVSAASSQGQAFASTYADDIDTDYLEEMDLKWHVAMLTMRMKRFIKKIGRNMNFNGKETVGFDKTKIKCYNCHKRGHFARECRAPMSQGNRNGDNTKRVIPVKTPANALVVTAGMGYDWSYQAEEGPTDFALMAFSSSGSSNSDNEVNTCSKECLQSYQTLQKHYDQ
uniref:Copia protein n=1 Tax=Tanacetum cinerariifolium TaxID=118510 RepID=A0A6L2KY56_TANCI|nr:copia protein [Tanacetum cinerariifolium]